MRTKFAKVTWGIEDVLERRPNWTKDQAFEFLTRIERQLESDMVRAGWDTIDHFLDTEDWKVMI